jgi:uncharacterized protein YbjT (DUF2867 family)
VQRFVHVSSLAAREPKLSLYGASKAKAEALVHSSGLAWTIVRPPAVYGPGDRETLELFRMAKLGLMVMPPKGRVSIIHADDLARLLLALAEPGAPSNILIEPDEARRARRPAVPRRESQAYRRPRRLFLAPKLGRRTETGTAAGAVAASRQDRPGPHGDRNLVPRPRLVVRR